MSRNARVPLGAPYVDCVWFKDGVQAHALFAPVASRGEKLGLRTP
jgi:hypothetical protein